MRNSAQRGTVILGVLAVGIIAYLIWSQTTSVRVKKLVAAVPTGQPVLESDPEAQSALDRLSAIGPQAIPVMVEQLSQANSSKGGLYYGFVRIGPEAAPALIDYLRREHESRNVATAALANMAPLGPQHLEALLDLAWMGDSLTRSRCIVAAAKINRAVTAARFERILEDDLHSSTIARVHAAIALDAIGPVNDHFAKMIEEARGDPKLAPFMPSK